MATRPEFEYRNKNVRLNRILTAVIIVMALCVVLFPVLVRAKSKLRDRSCASNLRQIGMALTLYASNYDEHFPIACDPSDRAVNGMWEDPKQAATVKKFPLLSNVLKPYVKSPAVFHCPLDNGGLILENRVGTEAPPPFVSSPSMFAEYGSSYLMRTDIVFMSMIKKGYWPNARTAVLFDAYGHWHADEEPLGPSMDFKREIALAESYKYNVLFGDGHVGMVPFDELQALWASRL